MSNYLPGQFLFCPIFFQVNFCFVQFSSRLIFGLSNFFQVNFCFVQLSSRSIFVLPNFLPGQFLFCPIFFQVNFWFVRFSSRLTFVSSNFLPGQLLLCPDFFPGKNISLGILLGTQGGFVREHTFEDQKNVFLLLQVWMLQLCLRIFAISRNLPNRFTHNLNEKIFLKPVNMILQERDKGGNGTLDMEMVHDIFRIYEVSIFSYIIIYFIYPHVLHISYVS